MNPADSDSPIPQDDRDFESLLAAFGARELTAAEHERFWSLLSASPQRVETWQEECRMLALLGSLADPSEPPNSMRGAGSGSVSAVVPAQSARQSWWLVGVACVVLFCLTALIASDSRSIGGESLVARKTRDADQSSFPDTAASNGATESRLSQYEQAVARLPVTASQNRPPTDFENVAVTPVSTASSVDFNDEIRPILADKCFHCHGPDEHSREAGLRLDTEQGAFEDLGGYAAFAPGDLESSEAIARITTDDPDSQMPPADFHKQLSDDEKQLISRWVESGALWKKHWVFEPPRRATVPHGDDDERRWGNNEIDAFVLAGMKRQGLTPNPEADRYSLARRAALDIIGLPPSQEQLQAFLDDTSDDAYEAYVDRLLASKHYGEHRARFWLDAARYGDTHGMHLDNYREMWPYRDWVINALNDNMPFDQFVTEQLAGDLLDEPTKDQLIATGFNRNHITTAEGGSIPEELAARYMIDRTETVSTIFLGLTTGCAACHDHKYDPISQKEFYSLAAFFNNSVDSPMDGNRRDHYPVLVVPTEDQRESWTSIKEEQDRLQALIDRRRDAINDRIPTWWDQTPADELLDRNVISDQSLELHVPFDQRQGDSVVASVGNQTTELPAKNTALAVDHPYGARGVRLTDQKGVAVAMDSPFQPDSEVTISMWLRTPNELQNIAILKMMDEGNKTKKIPSTGWSMKSNLRGNFDLTIADGENPPLTALMPGETPLLPKSWQHISVRYRGGQAASSINFFVDGQRRQERRNNDFHCDSSFGERMPDKLIIGEEAQGAGFSDLRIYSRSLSNDEIAILADEPVWRQLVRDRPSFDELSDDQRDLVKRVYRFAFDSKTIEWSRQRESTQRRHDYLYARQPTTQIMRERTTPAKAHVLIRGEYDNLGDEVAAATPAVLPPLEVDGPANRLDLAKWLLAPSHPTTARVTVNRYWQSLFGRGLVGSAGDFGTMGDKPTHPELLDHLAVQFQESGWDVKAILRKMVLSATYRQSSRFSDEMLAKDPDNHYLSTGPRRRLDAEVIRDQALAVAGILDRRIGGESVKPYQPMGVWKPVAFASSNTREFEQDPLGKIHRRSIYTFWKRTAIHPAFSAFDAPTREECSVRRERTNTPLQALVLLNDVQHVEAARVLAEKLVVADNQEQRILGDAFFRVVGRPMGDADRVDLKELLALAREYYQSDPEAARSLATTGDLPHNETLDSVDVASWTLLINTLMNRDDVINQS